MFLRTKNVRGFINGSNSSGVLQCLLLRIFIQEKRVERSHQTHPRHQSLRHARSYQQIFGDKSDNSMVS